MSMVDLVLRAHGARPDAIVTIVGPTASGKTDLAVSVAERLGGEIISVDSVQIYRGFDVGSGKPTPEETARAAHHLVDVLGPDEHIDAARFAALARSAIDDVIQRGKVPVVCGGAFLWTKALFFGLAGAPPASAAARARHQAILAEGGPQALHDLLRAVDEASAARLHPNDVIRTSRALEVFEESGRPMSVWQTEHAFEGAWREPLYLGVRRTPEELTPRIQQRARGWLSGGWVEEVQRLLAEGHHGARAMSSVGYREVRAFLDGGLRREDLETKIVQSTRIFARRQRTWLNRVDVAWLAPSDA